MQAFFPDGLESKRIQSSSSCGCSYHTELKDEAYGLGRDDLKSSPAHMV